MKYVLKYLIGIPLFVAIWLFIRSIWNMAVMLGFLWDFDPDIFKIMIPLPTPNRVKSTWNAIKNIYHDSTKR